MTIRTSILCLIACTFSLSLQAQFRPTEQQQQQQKDNCKNGSCEDNPVPEGIYTWHIDPRFGSIQRVPMDTVTHLFPNEAYTDGMWGEYNYLGNAGSPRVSRLFTDHRFTTFQGQQFIFANPYDYFLREPNQLFFTNTRSPFTNLTYHECGDKHDGEDHFRSRFAVNVNAKFGLGFNVDYLYGRGYYNAQSTSQFNTTFYASYLGDRYRLHTYYSGNYLKMRENGGIESDDYIKKPQIFPYSYNSNDIPTRLEKTFNKMHLKTFYLTHRYNFGFYKYTDKNGNEVSMDKDRQNRIVNALAHRSLATDSTTHDSLHQHLALNQAADTTEIHGQFTPVVGLIHTFRLDHNNRLFLMNDQKERAQSFFNKSYLPFDSAHDDMRYLHIENLLALEVSEGFSKWVKSGLRLYAAYDFYRYGIPAAISPQEEKSKSYIHPESTYHDHYVTAGAELFKKQGRYFHYDVLGELRSNGNNWGEFNVEGKADFTLPLKRDSLVLVTEGFLRNEQPDFFFRHFHTQYAWWDKDLDNVLTLQLGGKLRYKNTAVSVSWREIHNYTHLVETSYWNAEDKKASYGLNLTQKNGLLHLLALQARQDIRWGIFNWENSITFQTSSDKEAYPVPALNVWSNMFLKFRFAKVLGIELGADVRFFTPYYALTYSPIAGLYATQGKTQPQSTNQEVQNLRTKVGNYPIVNGYVNFDLKRTRFYLAFSHLNRSKGHGNPFLVPHYPLNPLLIRFGISWNFIN